MTSALILAMLSEPPWKNFSESYLDICEFEQSEHFRCIASNGLGNI